MSKEREELLKRNKNIISLHMPDFSKMSNDELSRRAEFMERAFEYAFDDEDESEEL